MSKRLKPRYLFSATVAMTLVACTGGGSGSSVKTAPIDAGTAAITADTTVATIDAGAGTTPTAGTTPAARGWTVDTSACTDPTRAERPIVGDIKVGAAMPLSGGPAAAFRPLKDGFKLYLDYASAKGLLPGYTITADIRDDQYDPTQTPGAVDGLIVDGVDLFSGIIGSPDNLAARDRLNKDCIPQLMALTGSPAWGQIDDYPWTTGALVPYDEEAAIYATKLNELKPGAKVALYSINNDFGKAYIDEFKKKAAEFGLEIVDDQTVEPNDINPPSTQVGSIAAQLPDAIVAVPLSLQCPTFLAELADVKAQTAGWDPLVFVTNTCASKLFLGLAGEAAEGVFTSNNLVDADDPKNATHPGVQAFLETYNAAKLTGDPAVTEAGWNVGESTVNILNAALKTGTLSRKSIIESARNLTFTPSLGREGVQYKMSGTDDVIPYETLQVLQWNVASQTFTEIGDPISQYEH